MTKEVFERSWCAGEITSAHRNKVNIVLVNCWHGDPSPSRALIESLEKLWSPVQYMQLLDLGVDVNDIVAAYQHLQALHAAEVVAYDIRRISVAVGKCKGLTLKTDSHGATLMRRISSSGRSSGRASDRSSRRISTSSAALQGVFDAVTSSERDTPIVILGDPDDAEGTYAAEILQIFLQMQMCVSVTIASPNDVSAIADYLVVLLTKGVLSSAVFAWTLVSLLRNGMAPVPLVTDTGFVFPDARFWEDFEARKVFGREQPGYDQIDQVGFGEVGRAYRSLFSILLVRFSAHGSKGVIDTEVAELVARIRNLKSFAVSTDAQITFGEDPLAPSGEATKTDPSAPLDNCGEAAVSADALITCSDEQQRDEDTFSLV